MKAYSMDLPERVAAACGLPGHTLSQVAAHLRVWVSFVEKLLPRQHKSGWLAALPLRGGPVPCLDAFARAELVACLRQQPDATLQELRVWLAALGGPAVSPATLGRAVQALEWRRKKRVFMPPSATPTECGPCGRPFAKRCKPKISPVSRSWTRRARI